MHEDVLLFGLLRAFIHADASLLLYRHSRHVEHILRAFVVGAILISSPRCGDTNHTNNLEPLRVPLVHLHLPSNTMTSIGRSPSIQQYEGTSLSDTAPLGQPQE